MTFSVGCTCGERFHTDDANVGRRLRCRRCGREVEVRRPTPPFEPSPHPGSARTRRHRRARFTRLRVSLSILVWAYLALAVGSALLMWRLGDRWWPATLLLFMGRWVYLLPLVALVPAAVLLQRVLLVPITVATLVVLGPMMGGRVGFGRLLPMPEGIPLRVVTFNAGGGQAIASQLPDLLAEWSADVVLMQECGASLAAASEHVPEWRWHHEGGLCLLTRFPIIRAEPMDRLALERVRQDAAAGIGGAGYVVRYKLRTAGGDIGVTNLHLETPRKGFERLLAGDVEPLRQNILLRDIESALARRWVDGNGRPTIVGGDFNTPEESRIFQDHWGDLTDAFSRAGRGFGATKHNGWIRIRIDHVLTDAAWRPVRAFTWPDVGSDHRPLVADLVRVVP